VIAGADVFLGLSAGGVLKPAMVAAMAPRPLIFALANPTPEIMPEEVKAVRDDAIMATGRTDYPNQVNNVLCFPYIFRGALDCGATTDHRRDGDRRRARHRRAGAGRAERGGGAAYAGATLSFGPEYLIPKPFDPRLMMKIAPAVARRRPSRAWRAADRRLRRLPREAAELRLRLGHDDEADLRVAKRAKARKRVAYAEGEDERVLRAVQVVVDEGLARPMADRPAGGDRAAHREVRPALQPGVDYDVVNVEDDPRYRDFWQTYHRMTERKGVTEQFAKIEMRRRLTLIGAMLLHKGEVDGMICGTWGSTRSTCTTSTR
jgi:malate dehydrogenase (oxaloacetate-decarboxylating)(NADP+)